MARRVRFEFQLKRQSMLVYQVRRRVFRLGVEREILFPADVTLRFHWKPGQPFGMETGGGLTAVTAVAAKALFNANNGRHSIASNKPLDPLDVIIDEKNRLVSFKGDLLTVNQQFGNLKEIYEFISSVFHGIPLLLNAVFADPPYVDRVDGEIGGVPFCWEVADWRMQFSTTTQQKQETAVADAWFRASILSAPHRRRLLAALHYFHVACRLNRAGDVVGEFLAEMILNLAKSLQALFSPAGDGRDRDAVRQALGTLGYSEDEIEANFVPALALRNELGVGHVELGLFSLEQLTVVHAYTDRAEHAFRELFQRILTKIEVGEFDVEPYKAGPPRREAQELIERLKQRTPSHAL